MASASKANPYGTFGVNQIVREEGVFYQVKGLTRLSGFESARFRELVIADLSGENALKLPVADAEDHNANEETGIYSATLASRSRAGGLKWAAGAKAYLKRIEIPEGGTQKYSFNVISVVEDVTFPVAKSYEHMNYGMWASLKEDGEMPSDLGIGFVRTLDGKSMTADMLTKGTATYHGHWVANVRKAHEEGTGDIIEMEGGSKTTANFATNAITVDLLKKDSATDKFASLTGGTISGNRFKGTGVTVVETTTSGLKTTGKYTEGDSGFSGAFFGPEAVEVGGVFHFTSKDKKDGEFTGAFGGRKM